MSQALTAEPKELNNVRLQKSQSRLFRTMVWKELRETGFYGLVIMATSALAIIFGAMLLPELYWMREYFGNNLVYISLGKFTPVLLVLVCVSTSFSIEHENRSYQFLRSLPCSMADIIRTKLTAMILLLVVCCLLFWPLTLSITESVKSRNEYLGSLPPTLLLLVEAFLWALYFSVREKVVIRAIAKASVGFFLATNGPAFVLQSAFGSSPQWDADFFWRLLVIRLSVVTCLAFLVRKSISKWAIDANMTVARPNNNARAIQFAAAKPLAATRRLVWLLFRTHGASLAICGPFSLILVVTYYLSLYASSLSVGTASVLWVLAVAMLGNISGRYDSMSRLLITSGYRPVHIWLTHTSLLLTFSLLGAVWSWSLIGPSAPPSFSTIWWYTNAALIAFGMGQLGSLLCRSSITASAVSLVLGFCGYIVHLYSLMAFEHQLATLVVLAYLPMGLSLYYGQRRATTGLLGRAFKVIAPVLFAAALLPLPLLRIYEAPDADVQAIKKFSVDPDKRNLDSLYAARLYTDSLEKKTERYKKYRTWEYKKEIEELNELLLQTSANQLTLLQNDQADTDDLKRYLVARSAFQQTLDRAITRTRDFFDDGDGEDYSLVDQVVQRNLDWNLYFTRHELLYYWAHHPETRRDDIRGLIERLADEDEVFDLYRVYALAYHRYSLGALSTPHTEFPRVLHSAVWTNRFLEWFPWEYVRSRRHANTLLHQEWQAIDQYQTNLKEHNVGLPMPENRLRYTGDLVTTYREIYRVEYSSTLSRTLFFRRANRLYLALLLWQKEHDGNLPADLSELEKDYLSKVPVSPINGESFYVAPNGLTHGSFRQSNHVEFLNTEWLIMRRYAYDPRGTAAAQPFIWINDAEKNDRRYNGPAQKIRSLEDFETNDGFSRLSFWILPKPRSSD